MRTLPLILIALSFTNSANATQTCAQVRKKAETKKGKAACVLIEHTAPMLERGEGRSVYQCGNIKYTLTTLEDDTCTVSPK